MTKWLLDKKEGKKTLTAFHSIFLCSDWSVSEISLVLVLSQHSNEKSSNHELQRSEYQSFLLPAIHYFYLLIKRKQTLYKWSCHQIPPIRALLLVYMYLVQLSLLLVFFNFILFSLGYGLILDHFLYRIFVFFCCSFSGWFIDQTKVQVDKFW